MDLVESMADLLNLNALNSLFSTLDNSWSPMIYVDIGPLWFMNSHHELLDEWLAYIYFFVDEMCGIL